MPRRYDEESGQYYNEPDQATTSWQLGTLFYNTAASSTKTAYNATSSALSTIGDYFWPVTKAKSGAEPLLTSSATTPTATILKTITTREKTAPKTSPATLESLAKQFKLFEDAVTSGASPKKIKQLIKGLGANDDATKTLTQLFVTPIAPKVVDESAKPAGGLEKSYQTLIDLLARSFGVSSAEDTTGAQGDDHGSSSTPPPGDIIATTQAPRYTSSEETPLLGNKGSHQRSYGQYSTPPPEGDPDDDTLSHTDNKKGPSWILRALVSVLPAVPALYVLTGNSIFDLVLGKTGVTFAEVFKRGVGDMMGYSAFALLACMSTIPFVYKNINFEELSNVRNEILQHASAKDKLYYAWCVVTSGALNTYSTYTGYEQIISAFSKTALDTEGKSSVLIFMSYLLGGLVPGVSNTKAMYDGIKVDGERRARQTMLSKLHIGATELVERSKIDVKTARTILKLMMPEDQYEKEVTSGTRSNYIKELLNQRGYDGFRKDFILDEFIRVIQLSVNDTEVSELLAKYKTSDNKFKFIENTLNNFSRNDRLSHIKSDLANASYYLSTIGATLGNLNSFFQYLTIPQAKLYQQILRYTSMVLVNAPATYFNAKLWVNLLCSDVFYPMLRFATQDQRLTRLFVNLLAIGPAGALGLCNYALTYMINSGGHNVTKHFNPVDQGINAIHTFLLPYILWSSVIGGTIFARSSIAGYLSSGATQFDSESEKWAIRSKLDKLTNGWTGTLYDGFWNLLKIENNGVDREFIAEIEELRLTFPGKSIGGPLNSSFQG